MAKKKTQISSNKSAAKSTAVPAGLKGSSRLNACGLGMTFGLLCAIDVLLLGLLTAAGKSFLWYNEAVYNAFAATFPGFSTTVGGIVIGVIWGAVIGFISGILIAWLYNKFSSCHSCAVCR